MSWEAGEPALQERVLERQRITIQNYANDPDLLAEHVGMEDNFQAGGYGERQIEELLQNAIDQLTAPGKVEFRIADGALYCANEGTPFGAEGIKAVTGAFLSAKKDEKIGRFGLGFKSVLGVTDCPQILSRSISFGFNSPDAKALLADLPYHPRRVPTLRVPSVLDANAIAREDKNVAEMMEWASTIVRLPLIRGGQRLVDRLKKFDVRYLLFPDRLAEVEIRLDGQEPRLLRRSVGEEPDLVQLHAPGEEPSTWRVLHRDHEVSHAVAAELPGLFHRDRVRVSYALRVGGRREDGEFWAWFPLLDKTTAQGIFNAPWQVNDDRTSMKPGSRLNNELLEVAADLLIDAALLESTPADPARHFDVLPARGRETRSNADRFMSDRVPSLARRHELIPTASGDLRAPSRIRAPYLHNASGQETLALPAQAVRRWSETTSSVDTPHWSCYSTATRAARLTQLLTDEDGQIASKKLDAAAWLSEAAKPRTLEAIDTALSIYLDMRAERREVWDQFSGARIIPLADGRLAKASDAPAVLLPVNGAEAPRGVPLVDAAFADDPAIRSKLGQLGVREVSSDQVALAVAELVAKDWQDADWQRLWDALALTSLAGGRAALDRVRARGIAIRVPTRAGVWRSAQEVFGDPAAAPGVASRQPDLGRVRGRSDLLAAAGCVADLSIEDPATNGKVFASYAAAMRRSTNSLVRAKYDQDIVGDIRFASRRGVRLLDVLAELNESDDPAAPAALARWTARVLELTPSRHVKAFLDLSGGARNQTVDLKSPELWCVEKIGLLVSSLGLAPIDTLLAKSLSAFGELVPVATSSLAGQLDLPSDLARIPNPCLQVLFERDDYAVSDATGLVELLAVAGARQEFSKRERIPAVDPRTGRVRLTNRSAVVLADEDELDDLLPHGLRYLPSGERDQAISAAWAISSAADAISRSIDWTVSGDPVPILDAYPSLRSSTDANLSDVLLQRCSAIVRRSTGPSGSKEHRLSGHLDLRTVLVDDEFDDIQTLQEASRLLRLSLTRADAERTIRLDESLRQSQLVRDVQAEESEDGKLLKLVGRNGLAARLPDGLLDIIESRQGPQSDPEVARLFLSSYGNDALRLLKEPLAALGLAVPRNWDGTSEAERFVTDLGFARSYAGSRERKPADIEMVPGRVELKPLHDFQEDLLTQIRELVLIRDKNGEHKRGLLYLPTGAGKTRVTTESIATMLRDDELAAPILWIAQSEELCEQAIVSWTEVWRAIGDERPLEITRYWDDHESDESRQELQVVIATDAKLLSMIRSPTNRQGHSWLRNSKLVVIDEAHRAGSSSYTEILTWLGITQQRGGTTERPLLGLTATPYRGTNEEVNRLFALRFGERRLNALDEDDPIGQLRAMRVLSNVDQQLLDGIVIDDAPTEGRTGGTAWNDVSRGILDKLGSNLDRTQLLVDHIMSQDGRWPILVFTPSVVSAHVTAALIQSLGRTAEAVDGSMRGQERRRRIDRFKSGETAVLVNCDLLTQGFDAPKVRALYIARPTFSPNRYVQMVGRGLRGPKNGGTEDCLLVNVRDTFTRFEGTLAYTQFDFLWTKKGARSK